MVRNKNKNWFEEKYGFFGEFYYIADNSSEGPFSNQKITREQRTENEIRMIYELLKLKKGDSLFDCPCGWGRHATQLAEKGINVFAIDLNKQYLQMFKESLQTKSESMQNRVEIKNCDMRNISNHHTLYDFGINMFSSFGFFDDNENQKVAQNFYNLLKPNGKMLIHLDFNAQRILKGKENDYAASRNIFHNNQQYTLDVKKSYCSDDKRLHGSWKLREESGKETTKYYCFRIYANDEIEILLRQVGFKNISFYSSKCQIQTEEDLDTVIVVKK
ncbi:MAG: class I SAM-dependent methyltransferase [Tannerella sp.]|jgi:cyclopropane fatty-acyl-phospholipid synthase-like methyltransferase|nr:class I SAM-dependent methyltransferase [Tannerella sp.]